MKLLRLPEEIIELVFSCVEDRNDLFALPLVSQICYRFTFSLIYHTVVLDNPQRLEEFLDEIEAETSDNGLRISRAVCCLILHDYSGMVATNREFEEYLVLRYQRIIPELVRLRHLTWDILFEFLEASTVFEVFERRCTRFKSVALWAPRVSESG